MTADGDGIWPLRCSTEGSSRNGKEYATVDIAGDIPPRWDDRLPSARPLRFDRGG